MPSEEPPKPDSVTTSTLTIPDLRRNAYKGRYAIERELGRGGFGIIYLARDLDLHGKTVVVKVLQKRTGEAAEWLDKKFRQECEALARIDHPGVVGVIDRGQTPDGTPFLVLDFVEGVALRQPIEAGMPLDRIARLITQLGQALSAAHDKGVFHRDLKPDNILLRDLGGGQELPVIIDFGIATVVDSQVRDNIPTQIAGSHHYMAPEQLEGKPDARSDIFALGVIAYQMIARKHPFQGESPVELYLQQKRGTWQKLTTLRPELAPAVDDVIGKALACEASERYQRADEFAADLARAVTFEHTEKAAPAIVARTAEANPEEKSPAPEAKRAWKLAGAILAGVLLLAASAGIAWVNGWLRPAVTTVPAPTLTYGLIVQKYRNGEPDGAPFPVAREMLFPADYRLALRFEAAQPGYLYLENEGPDGSWNTLFPSPSANGGSSHLAQTNAVRIPGEGFFRLDTQKGAEKLWILWAGAPVPELEKLKQWANTADKGQIKDAGQVESLSRLVRSLPHPVVEKDEAAKQTTLKSGTGLMAYRIQLDHY